MRRLVAPLLTVGAVLLVAVLVWPTDRMVVELPDGTVQPLLDIWLWGRVRSVSELSSTDVDGSVAVLAALAMAAALAVAAAVLWLRRSRDRARRRVSGTVAAVGVGAALAVAAVAVGQGGATFGWASPGGVPTFTRTVVAVFRTATFAVWGAALILMVVVLFRRRGGRDESAGEQGSD